MATLPGLQKGVTKDPSPPLVDTLLSPQFLPNGTTLVTTKTTNETIDNVDQIIDYISGDAGPNFIPQSAIATLLADLAARELLSNKVTVVGTPGNDANYPTEKAVRDAITGISVGVTSINSDPTAAQIIAGTTNRIFLVDAGDTHTFDIDAAYVGQASITTLGTITTGVWNGTAITGSNINAALADLSDVTAKTGTGTIVVMDTSPTIITPTIASFTNAGHDHENLAGGGLLDSTLALSDTINIAYLNTVNTYTPGATQFFVPDAGTVGINVGTFAGNPSGLFDADIWLNSSTNQLFARINGANVDLGGGAFLPLAGGTMGGDIEMVFNEIKFGSDRHSISGNVNDLTIICRTNMEFESSGTLPFFQFKSTGSTTDNFMFFDFVGRNTNSQDIIYGGMSPVINNNTPSSEEGAWLFTVVFGGFIDEPVLGMNVDGDLAAKIFNNLRFNNLGSGADPVLKADSTAKTLSLDGNFDLLGNNSTNFGILSFDDINTSIQQSSSDLQLDVAAGGGFELRFDNAIKYLITDTQFNFLSNSLVAVGGLTLIDAANIIIGTGTGTMIGTAASQKIGFFGATPIVQPVHIADATDAASVILRLNELLAEFAALGLQASS